MEGVYIKKYLLSLPGETHRRTKTAAFAEGVSMNQFIINTLDQATAGSVFVKADSEETTEGTVYDERK